MYYKVTKNDYPRWESFFPKGLNKNFDLRSISAVMFEKISIDGPGDIPEERTFAITFGLGRYLLKDGVIETRFGLQTTLNSVNPESISSIEANTIDFIPTSSKTQASKKVGLRLMGFDGDKQVLKRLKGITRDAYIDTFGKSLQGADSLSFATDKDCSNIKEILKVVWERYKSDNYILDFDELSNLIIITDKTLRKNLDVKVCEAIQNNADCVWLGVPEVLDSTIVQFGKTERELYDEISLDWVLKDFKIDRDNFKKENLKNKRIIGFNSAGQFQKSWSINNCLYAEIEYDSKTYILNAGIWYQIEKDFVDGINRFYENIPLSSFGFIPYTDLMTQKVDGKVGETLYNKALFKVDETHRELCDAQNIYLGGGQNKFEFCDVYTSDKQLIHIKLHTSSATLSHLFNQGLESAQLSKTSKEFRKKVNEKFQERSVCHLPEKKLDSQEYTIIFGIIQKAQDKHGTVNFRPKIPLFSKIALKNVIDILHGFDYKVEIAGIENQL